MCVADLDEQFQSLRCAEVVLVAIVGDSNAADQLHYKVGSSVLGSAGVEDLGDVRMVHHRQRLAFRSEAGNDLARVHTWLDNLEGNAAADRLLLFGYINNPTSAFTDLLAQFVMTDARAGLFLRR